MLELIRAGNRRTAAARAAGVSDATFFRYMADPRPMYQRFRAEVERAEAEFEADLVDVVVRAVPDSPQLAWRMLETRSGEWRRAKLPPDPEPEPSPVLEHGPRQPAVTILLSQEEYKEILLARARDKGLVPPLETDPEVLAARQRLVTDLTPGRPSVPCRFAQDRRPVTVAVEL